METKTRKIGEAHARLWALRRGPGWCRQVVSRREDGSSLVDACVNHNAGVSPSSSELEASNLLSLLRSARRSGGSLELACRLRQIGYGYEIPRDVPNPARRAAYARKWLRRLAETTSRKILACCVCGRPSSIQDGAYSGRYVDYVGEDGCTCVDRSVVANYSPGDAAVVHEAFKRGLL